MADEIVKKDSNNFSVSLTNYLMDQKSALPEDLNVTRFVANAVALLNGNDTLASFARANGTGQIKAGLLRGAILGLDALSKEYYLIPYNKKLEFMLDYRGAAKLCKKYSVREILEIYAKLVRQGDDFKTYVKDGVQGFEHDEKPFNDGAIVGAYAVCIFKDGGLLIDTMSKADIENSRKQSKAANSPAWTKFYGEMAKKTVLHRLCKMIQLDFENPLQTEEFQRDGEVDNKETYTGNIPNPFSEVADFDRTMPKPEPEIVEVVDGTDI